VPEIVSEYKPEDMFNMDEMGLFYLIRAFVFAVKSLKVASVLRKDKL